jgi:hypothetical protein
VVRDAGAMRYDAVRGELRGYAGTELGRYAVAEDFGTRQVVAFKIECRVLMRGFMIMVIRDHCTEIHLGPVRPMRPSLNLMRMTLHLPTARCQPSVR